MTPMMEARAVKSPDEQNCSRIVGSICDALHYEMSQWLRPGLTENQVAAHGFEFPLFVPWRRGRGGRDRVVRAERLAELVHKPARSLRASRSIASRPHASVLRRAPAAPIA